MKGDSNFWFADAPFAVDIHTSKRRNLKANASWTKNIKYSLLVLEAMCPPDSFYNGEAMFWCSFTYLPETQGEWNFLVSVGSTVSQVKAMLNWQSKCGKAV